MCARVSTTYEASNEHKRRTPDNNECCAPENDKVYGKPTKILSTHTHYITHMRARARPDTEHLHLTREFNNSVVEQGYRWENSHDKESAEIWSARWIYYVIFFRILSSFDKSRWRDEQQNGIFQWNVYAACLTLSLT